GMLYALCSAFGTDSKIVRIDAQSFSVVDQVVLPAGVGYAMNLDIHNGTAYFTGEGKIFKMYATAESFDGTPLVDTQSDSDYMGYGFAVGNDRIFISEAAEDFSSDGRVLVYTISGELIAEIPAGLGPNGFYFN